MRTRHSLLSLLALSILALAGCGKEETVSGPSPVNGGAKPNAPAVATITGPELDKVVKGNKRYKIVLIVKTRNNPFFTPMINAFEAESKALGVDCEVQAPLQEQDKEQQSALVEQVAAKGVDAILIAPADSKAIIPVLLKAQAKGILVVNIDNRIDKGEAQNQKLSIDGYVGADNESGGVLAGEAMVDTLKTGKVAILEGIRGADNAEARKKGFEQGVKGKLDVVATDTANWDKEQAYSKVATLLAAHPELNGIFCANDNMAVGAVKAIDEAHKKGNVTVVGYDNIPEVKPLVANGQMYATIEQHPDLMGKYGVQMAVGILNGAIPKGREYMVPLELIKKL